MEVDVFYRGAARKLHRINVDTSALDNGGGSDCIERVESARKAVVAAVICEDIFAKPPFLALVVGGQR